MSWLLSVHSHIGCLLGVGHGLTGFATFLVLGSLGQMVTDHALIVSNAHLTSSAQLNKEAIQELNQILSKLQALAENSRRGHLVFEHGVPSEGTSYGGCGICHCHIHSLPVEKPDYNPTPDLEAFLRKKNCKFERRDLSSWDEIRELAKNSYLCVKVGKNAPAVFVFDFGQRVESQLMRQFLAENCPNAKTDWDWRSTKDNAEELQKTCERINTALIEAPVSSTPA